MSRRLRRVTRYVDALLRDRRPPRGAQDPDDLEALAAAVDLSSTRPQAGMPDPRLDCPCHRAAFGPGGDVLYHEQPTALRPLPRIPARVRDGQVEVNVV